MYKMYILILVCYLVIVSNIVMTIVSHCIFIQFNNYKHKTYFCIRIQYTGKLSVISRTYFRHLFVTGGCK